MNLVWLRDLEKIGPKIVLYPSDLCDHWAYNWIIFCYSEIGPLTAV